MPDLRHEPTTSHPSAGFVVVTNAPRKNATANASSAASRANRALVGRCSASAADSGSPSSASSAAQHPTSTTHSTASWMAPLTRSGATAFSSSQGWQVRAAVLA